MAHCLNDGLFAVCILYPECWATQPEARLHTASQSGPALQVIGWLAAAFAIAASTGFWGVLLQPTKRGKRCRAREFAQLCRPPKPLFDDDDRHTA